ncbi:MAG: sigma-70 family RNA polymerase sigma factor [Actinobacteria bacterium]|nr:sigma-70 family RNA polymerase sigma factor [Actinomycetota bacterium]
MTQGGPRDRAAYERDSELVPAARAGDDNAFAALFDEWFDPVFDAARRIVDDNGVAAEVAQDTFLSVWQHLGDLREPSTFGAFALRTARNRALNRSAKERRSVAVDDIELVSVIDDAKRSSDASEPLSRREGDALVWAASVALGERDTSILDLHLRHGLTAPELADELGVTPNNAHQLLFRMKKKLGAAIEAWVLWKGGSPSCADLSLDLDRAGVQRFSADAVRVINRHVEGCSRCGDRKAAMLAPEALFASVPIAIVAPAIRNRVAANLQALGVPSRFDGATGAAASATSSTEASSEDGADGTGPPATAPPAARRTLLASVAALVLLLAIGGAIALSRGSSTELVDTSAPASTAARGGQMSPTSPAGSAPGPEASVRPGDLGATEPSGDTTPDPVGDPLNGSPSSTAASTPGQQATVTVTIPPTVTFTIPPPTPSTTTPTAPPPAAPPNIDAFTKTLVAPPPPECGSPQNKYRFEWTTTDATHVTITGGANAPVGDQAADGSVIVCVPLGPAQTYLLTAFGPGGTDTAVLSVP